MKANINILIQILVPFNETTLIIIICFGIALSHIFLLIDRILWVNFIDNLNLLSVFNDLSLTLDLPLNH